MLKTLTDHEKLFIDVASIATGVGALVQILPELAAGLTIMWTVIRIYETETVQKMLGRRKNEQN